MTARYEVGEVVDVTIKGARIAETFEKHWRLKVGSNDLYVAAELLPLLTIERVAPKEWPPQPGDVWATLEGEHWFARSDVGGGVRLSPEGADRPSEHPDTVQHEVGPMWLAYRRGWTPESAAIAAAAAAAEPVEPESEGPGDLRVVGLRQLADLLEANPQLPLPTYGLSVTGSLAWGGAGGTTGAIARLEQAASLLGQDVKHMTYDGNIHYAVETQFADVTFRLSYIAPAETGRPAPVVTGDGAATQTLLGAEEVAGPVGAGPATEPEAETLLAVEEVGGSGSGHGKAEPPTGPAAKPTSPLVVLVASPIPGGPPARAEVAEDKGGTTVKVIYCDSRTGARVARRRILGLETGGAYTAPDRHAASLLPSDEPEG